MNDLHDRTSLLDQLFGIDIRGLSAFRLATGVLLAAEAVSSLRELELAPDAALASWLDLDWFVLLVCGLLLGAGRWVQPCCLLAWALLCRHAAVDWTGGSIDLHRYLLTIGTFWNAIVPADRLLAWRSVEARPLARRVLSFATAALLLQIVFVYFSAGLSKKYPEWLGQADAMTNLMHTHYATPLGRSLLAWPWILPLLSVATIVIEVAAPIACLVPGRFHARIRNGVVLLMAAFHFGLLLTMKLDLIPLVCLSYWLLMVPTSTWDWIWPRPDLVPDTAGEPSAVMAGISKLGLAGITTSFLLSTFVCLDESATLLKLHQATPKIGIYQDWRMFGSPRTLRQIDEERLSAPQAGGHRAG